MVDAYRTEVSAGIQGAYGPIDGTESKIGSRHPIQSAKYKSEIKNRIAHKCKVTSQPTEADHRAEDQFQQFFFQINYYHYYYYSHSQMNLLFI